MLQNMCWLVQEEIHKNPKISHLQINKPFKIMILFSKDNMYLRIYSKQRLPLFMKKSIELCLTTQLLKTLSITIYTWEKA